MHFTKLVPELYYSDINSALETFVERLEFTVVFDDIKSENPYCVVSKDGLTVLLIQNKEYAEKFNPLLRLVTNNIEEVYEKIASKYPEMLHPNLTTIILRSWGAKEFAVLDDQIGIVFQQW